MSCRKKSEWPFCNTIVDVCDKSFPRVWNPYTRALCRIYVGQVLTPLLSIKSVQTIKLADIMARVGDFLGNDGKYKDCANLLEEVVQSVLRGRRRGRSIHAHKRVQPRMDVSTARKIDRGRKDAGASVGEALGRS